MYLKMKREEKPTYIQGTMILVLKYGARLLGQGDEILNIGKHTKEQNKKWKRKDGEKNYNHKRRAKWLASFLAHKIYNSCYKTITNY